MLEREDEGGTKQSMTVAVRIRPFETSDCLSPLMSVSSSTTSENTLRVLSSSTEAGSTNYRFDFVHWSTGTDIDSPHTATQERVFEDLGAPLVASALQGFNCTIFAYGQTGAGKTHTMIGVLPTNVSCNSSTEVSESLCSQKTDDEMSSEAGVIPRVCHHLIAAASSSLSEPDTNSSNSSKSLSNTGGSGNSTRLRVREHPTDGPFVEGATIVPVSSYQECIELLRLGENNRQSASTKMNQHSSRSHAIFTITCIQTKSMNSGGGVSSGVVSTVVSKFNLVDLAGSENAFTSGSIDHSSRLKEGVAINKSLLALGRVIKALADHANINPRRNTPGRLSLASTSTNTDSNRRRSLNSVLLNTPKSSQSQSNQNIQNSVNRRTSHPGTPSSRSVSFNTIDSECSNGQTPNSSRHVQISAPSKTRQIVPYRDSVLTYLLKESLGGNSKTTMIASIRPGLAFAEETAHTLKYAAEACKVVNVVSINENPYMKMIRQLQEEVDRLTKQLAVSVQSFNDRIPLAATSRLGVTATTQSSTSTSRSTSTTGIVPPEILLTPTSSPGKEKENKSGDSLEAITEESDTISQLADLQFKMQLVLQSSDSCQRSHEKQQRIRSIDHNVKAVSFSSEKISNNLLNHFDVEDESDDVLGELQTQRGSTTNARMSVSVSSVIWKSLGLELEGEEEGSSEGVVSSDVTTVHQEPDPKTLKDIASEKDSFAQNNNNNNNNNNLDQFEVGEENRRSSEVMRESSMYYWNDEGIENNDEEGNDLELSDDKKNILTTENKNMSKLSDGTKLTEDLHNLQTVPPFDHVLKEGFLMKRGFVNTAFRRRWCILKGQYIFFYKKYRDKQIRGKIRCAGASVKQYEPVESLPFAFYLFTPRDKHHKKWLLQAASDDEYHSWKTCIEIVATLYDSTSKESPAKRSEVLDNANDFDITKPKEENIISDSESNCIIS